MRLPDFEAWAIFAQLVEHKSFTATAAALGVSKATVSKAITRLETQLDASLFNRTSRQLALTQAGRRLADHAARILAEGMGAEEAALDEAQALSGCVRLAAPLGFGLKRVAPLAAEFMTLHPGVSIDLHLSDARIDIVELGLDATLRIAAMPDSSLKARRLCDVPAGFVAAPAYLERHGTPRHAADLADHACFSYTYLPTPDLWQVAGPGGQRVAVQPKGPFRVNNGEAMLPALRAGLGVAMLPDFITQEDLAAGRLFRILPDWSPPPVALHLVTPPSRLRPARVEALLDFLAERLRKEAA